MPCSGNLQNGLSNYTISASNPSVSEISTSNLILEIDAEYNDGGTREWINTGDSRTYATWNAGVSFTGLQLYTLVENVVGDSVTQLFNVRFRFASGVCANDPTPYGNEAVLSPQIVCFPAD